MPLWSQAELGDRIGAYAGQISRYENGKINPSADAVAGMSNARRKNGSIASKPPHPPPR